MLPVGRFTKVITESHGIVSAVSFDADRNQK
jgi:hypothetical protein